MTRTTLNNRRRCMTADLTHNGQRLVVSVGLDADNRVKEVFAGARGGANGDRISGDLDIGLADTCITVSVALQHGIPLADLGKSLVTVPAVVDGAECEVPASPIGAVLALAAEADADPAGWVGGGAG